MVPRYPNGVKDVNKDSEVLRITKQCANVRSIQSGTEDTEMVPRTTPKGMNLDCRREESEASIIERLKNSDEKVLEFIIDEYQRPLFNYVLYVVRVQDQAEDIVQDVFIQLWNTRERIQLGHSLKNYLYRIARNMTLNSISSDNARRRRESEVQLERDEMVVEPGSVVDDQKFDEALRGAIEQLPDRCAEIFVLVRQHHMSYSEVAELLDISVSTVKTQMGRAMSNLASRLAHLLSIAAILSLI